MFNGAVHHPADTLRRFFDLDAESTIPAWFSSIQLFAVGMTIALGLAHPRSITMPARRVLAVLAIAFVFLSADESVGVHEQITEVFGDVDALPDFKRGHGVWIPLYLTAGVVFTAVASPSLVRLYRYRPAPVRVIAVGLCLFVVGVVALEIVSYQHLRDAGRETWYRVEVAGEEFMEMLGVTVVWWGMVRLFEFDTVPWHRTIEP